MVTDPVAIAFANWVEAHKRHVEAEKRLRAATKIARSIGTLPTEALLAEVKDLKAEADRLLEIANQAMHDKGRGPG